MGLRDRLKHLLGRPAAPPRPAPPRRPEPARSAGPAFSAPRVPTAVAAPPPGVPTVDATGWPPALPDGPVVVTGADRLRAWALAERLQARTTDGVSVLEVPCDR